MEDFDDVVCSLVSIDSKCHEVDNQCLEHLPLNLNGSLIELTLKVRCGFLKLGFRNKYATNALVWIT